MRAQWAEFKQWPPGQRFALFNAKHRNPRSRWTKPLLIVGALVSFAVGIVLVFIPGPAIVFFALTAALIATQSRWLARRLDVAEMKTRRLWRTFRRKRAQHRA